MQRVYEQSEERRKREIERDFRAIRKHGEYTFYREISVVEFGTRRVFHHWRSNRTRVSF